MLKKTLKAMLLNARQIYRKDVGTQMILLAIEDITERKKVEKALEANEAKYQELVQDVYSLILKMDQKRKSHFFQRVYTDVLWLYRGRDALLMAGK